MLDPPNRFAFSEGRSVRVIDVDSHFHEPVDWLATAAPELAAELGPPVSFLEIAKGPNPLFPMLPPELQPDDSTELVTSSFREHNRRTALLQPEEYEPDSGNVFYDARARVELCDQLGVDVQFLSPTFAFEPLRAIQIGRIDLVPRLVSTWNSWAAEQVSGYTDRLMPITQANMSDIDFTIAEMTRMRAAGSRAFLVNQNPQMSLTHPDYDRMWSAAEDLGMAAYVHVFFGANGIHPSFANNGRSLETFHEMGFPDFKSSIQHMLMAMVFDGLFERHPRLALILAEVSTAWLPGLIHDMEIKTRRVAADGSRQHSFYKLPLSPSEYLQRQVRVSPLPGFVDTGFELFTMSELYEHVPHDVLVYSSDFPHLEGRKDAKSMYANHLPDDPAIRERFFGGSVGELLGI